MNSPFFKIGTPQCGLLMGLLGVAVAFLLIFLGFWKTLLIALFFAVGFWLGGSSEKLARFKQTVNKLFPPKGE